MEAPSPSPVVAELEAQLRERLGDAVLEVADNRGQGMVRARADQRPQVLRVLKDLGFTSYVFTCGVDWPAEDRMEVLDHVYSLRRRQRVTARYDLPRSRLRIPTATGVYAGADWMERETWEMFGIVFEGHPRLTRLLLPDWFEGFPLRKDFQLQARLEKPWPGEFFEG